MLGLRYYETAVYISRLPEWVRGRVLADIEAYRLYGVKAPISWKTIVGSRPMMEIRVGSQRVYLIVHQQTVWILQIGPKGHQSRDIEKAAVRMKHIRGG